jgi:hypothetical protein
MSHSPGRELFKQGYMMLDHGAPGVPAAPPATPRAETVPSPAALSRAGSLLWREKSESLSISTRSTRSTKSSSSISNSIRTSGGAAVTGAHVDLALHRIVHHKEEIVQAGESGAHCREVKTAAVHLF